MSMLRSIRERKGLTVGQLASRASISARTLTDYEEGRLPIPLSHAKLLAKALWVQVDDLMPPAGSAPVPRPAVPATAPATPQPAPAPPPSVQSQSQPPAQMQTPNPPYQQRPAAPPANQGPAPAPSYAPANGNPAGAMQRPSRPPEQSGVRPYRDPPGSRPAGASQVGKRGPEGRPTRPARPPSAPPRPISEGQTEELLRLGARLEMEPPQLEAQLNKPVSALTRSEAKDWIKKLREMAAENAPTGRVHYGRWPGSREDQEASYLSRQKEEGNILRFKLFNGEEFQGVVSDFTPYTITIRTLPGQEDTVLRKLAIVYYRQTGEATRPVAQPAAESLAETGEQTNEPIAEDQQASDVQHSHQPVETGVDSDRSGEPAIPERDNMDEDRGV